MTSITPDQPCGAGGHDKRSRVKARLTPNRRRRSVESDESGAFVRRVLHAYGRRVEDGDVEALVLLVGLAAEIDAVMAEAVKGLRACGYSWAEIGSRLAISRQAATVTGGQAARCRDLGNSTSRTSPIRPKVPAGQASRADQPTAPAGLQHRDAAKPGRAMRDRRRP
jgi:hypothetical protein